MRYRVRYKLGLLGGGIGAYGEGDLHVEETALIVQAPFAKVPVPSPLLRATRMREITLEPSVRTIPYSTIVRFEAPSYWVAHHTLVYRLPDRRQVAVRFTLMNPARGKELAYAIEDGRRLALSFQPRPGGN